MLSVVIASRNEQFLAQTVDDIFNKARGPLEVVVVLDEKEQELTPRPGLIVLKKEGAPGLKSAINQGVKAASGEYIMKTDAHCMFGESFDTILTAECEDDWMVIPRRYSLEPSDWSIRTHRPTVDYEYIPFPYLDELVSVKTSGKWHARAAERKDILIDENMTCQGSCYLMKKKLYEKVGGFPCDYGTGDDFIFESEELGNKVWLSGGKIMTNKKTWYAHLHKGSQFGRGYFMDKRPMKRQRIFHIDYWWHDRWPQATRKIEWLVEHFMPIPSWPSDWKKPEYEEKWRKVNGLEPVVTK